MTDSQRDTILVEDGEILSHEPHPADQFILRVSAPGIADRARPGTFAHLQCADDLPMRRPLSIMRSDPKTGDPADYPTGNVPQGDAIRSCNYVRAVRNT